ncbi:hypothetical protein AB1N83_005140 [Pleurotus pulmonarius]
MGFTVTKFVQDDLLPIRVGHHDVFAVGFGCGGKRLQTLERTVRFPSRSHCHPRIRVFEYSPPRTSPIPLRSLRSLCHITPADTFSATHSVAKHDRYPLPVLRRFSRSDPWDHRRSSREPGLFSGDEPVPESEIIHETSNSRPPVLQLLDGSRASALA